MCHEPRAVAGRIAETHTLIEKEGAGAERRNMGADHSAGKICSAICTATRGRKELGTRRNKAV